MFTRKTKYEIVAAGPYGQWAVRHRGAWKLRGDSGSGPRA
jgi:hypothetical protein